MAVSCCSSVSPKARRLTWDMEATGPGLMAGVAQIHSSFADLLPGYLLELVAQGHGVRDDLKFLFQGPSCLQ